MWFLVGSKITQNMSDLFFVFIQKDSYLLEFQVNPFLKIGVDLSEPDPIDAVRLNDTPMAVFETEPQSLLISNETKLNHDHCR
ncbi:hypothetical protein FOLKNPGA_03423 [Legionella sp. PC1000]|nr:hypothetical protein FOLKNPGA_03423 [Legionella sp. PC1000]